jgi:hypothetical protein
MEQDKFSRDDLSSSAGMSTVDPFFNDAIKLTIFSLVAHASMKVPKFSESVIEASDALIPGKRGGACK